MPEDKVQYIFAGVCILFVIISALTCLHLIQIRRSGVRFIGDIEINQVSATSNQAHRQVMETQSLTTDKALDKAFPPFTYILMKTGSSFKELNTETGGGRISYNVHQLFQSACAQTCIICLEDFIEEESMIRELKCHHIYHKSCIDQWLITRSLSCPLCKESIELEEESVEDEVEEEEIHPSTSIPNSSS